MIKNLFKQENRKLTEAELKEYSTIINLGEDPVYWESKFNTAVISFIGLMGLLGYVLLVAHPAVLVTIGTLTATYAVSKLVKQSNIGEIQED